MSTVIAIEAGMTLDLQFICSGLNSLLNCSRLPVGNFKVIIYYPVTWISYTRLILTQKIYLSIIHFYHLIKVIVIYLITKQTGVGG